MAHQISLREAKSRLPELLQTAIDGEEIIIVKGKQPLVHLIPHKKRFQRKIGTAQGEILIKEGFKNIPDEFKEYS